MGKTSTNVATVFDAPEFPARIRARDSDAIRAVVHFYLPQVLRTARGAGLGSHEAEDVAQATFTTFMEVAPRFEGRSHVRTWLYGILYRKIAEMRRHLDRDRRMDDIDDLAECRFDSTGKWSQPPQPADSKLLNREVRGQIEDCLDGSPVRQRTAFLLREVEGLSSREICKILGVTSTNLGVLLYRVRNRLRECLEAKGVWGQAQ